MWPKRSLLRGLAGVLGALVLTACSNNAGAPAAEVAAPAAAATAALPTITPAPAAEAITDTAAGETSTVASAETSAVAAPTFDPNQTGVTLQPVVEGLSQPLYVTHAGDGSGRLFVVEKAGRIQIVREGQVVASPFLDITDRVNSSANEQGLLGLAFAPNYGESGHFFVNYTNANGDTVVARFGVSSDNPDLADPGSELLVLTFDQPAANHNGGMVTFGPDGYLWIGTGDGGASDDRFGNGQNPGTYLGKMLRLDVTTDPTIPYTIPADNPWFNTDWNGAAVLGEIWAVGLRNPWRYSFDRATGDLWIADVGQNQYEEINFTPADAAGGLNYGWPIMEASACFQGGGCDTSGLVLPVAEYSHRGHCSVTGGYVYRGSAFPALQGVYFYGDYCSGVMWATWPAADSWTTAEVLSSGATLSSFGEDEAGEMYATDLGGGTLYQLVVAP